jgi:hypothetical protein
MAGASVFSGRPDPTWALSAEAAASIDALWRMLPATSDPPPVAPPLGYRGCFARDDGADRRWDAYGGVVVLAGPGGREARSDPERAFERQVLHTAPPGTLPPDLP